MAKKQPAKSARSEKRQAARKQTKTAKQKLSREVRLERKGTRNYTLLDCMRFGRIANILFILFIIVCLIYYYSLAVRGKTSVIFEIVAYTIETSAFALFTISVIWLDRLVRARGLMKLLLITYIAVEVILMLGEFHLLPLIPYNGLSVPLIIVHVLFSAAVSLSLLMLDPQNKRVQWLVGITSVIILAGMLTAIAGYRVYASILVNALGYIIFFTAMERLLHLEEVEIDCYGDRAEVKSFDSTMFSETPTMVEIPRAEKPKTLGGKAKRLAQELSTNEKLVLTDKDEKFEYEFGVDDDDDDDEYDAYDDAPDAYDDDAADGGDDGEA